MRMKKGFTLIEVMIVVSIIAVATAIVLVGMSNVRNQTQVKGDARRLAGTLRELQNNALTGKRQTETRISCWFSLPSAIIGAGSIAPMYRYKDGTTCATNLGDNLPLVVFSPGVVFSNANVGVRFVVPWGQALDAAGNVLGAPVRYTLEKSGIIWSVCVYPEGRIEETTGAICP